MDNNKKDSIFEPFPKTKFLKADYFYVRKFSSFVCRRDFGTYYDFDEKTTKQVATELGILPKYVEERLSEKQIPFLEDPCFCYGGREGCLNYLDQRFIKPSDTPNLHPDIKKLIWNLCNENKENVDYLMRSLWKKYINPNDFSIPAIIFHGAHGSGKGTWIQLLGKIFGEKNVNSVKGKSLEGSFNSYLVKKLIVEFQEVSTHNNARDKDIMNELKTLILQPTLSINEKNVKEYTMENIGWYFISSNDDAPALIEPGDRRFSVIRTGGQLDVDWAYSILHKKTMNNKRIISDFLAWIKQEYGKDIKENTTIKVLDNDDKRDLQQRAKGPIENFWEDMMIKYKGKTIPKNIFPVEFDIFCIENGYNKIDYDRFLDKSRPGKIKESPNPIYFPHENNRGEKINNARVLFFP